MIANDILDALNEVNDTYVWDAGHAGRRAVRKKPRVLYRALLAAVVVTVLASTVFGVGELLGIWNDHWLQTPASDPVQVVREAICRQTEKEYTLSVNVEQLLIDEAETQRIFAWKPNSILALRGGYGPRPEALEGKRLEDVKAIYARYSIVYDHEKTYYRDGTLNQYFYLIRSEEGKWEIFDSSPERNVFPADAAASGAPADYDAAIRTVTEMVKTWEDPENGCRVDVDKAVLDTEKTETALRRLNGTVLAVGNGWTEAYLKDRMAAITVTYTIWQDGSPATETATYWLLQDPATGTWVNSEITEIMESPDR